jgi:3-hydroxybutyryl-CoA dehydrogenase
MEVRTIGIIGAGTMGRGIAYAAAFGGYKTILEDVSPAMLEQSVAYIRKTLEDGVARGKVTPEQRDAAIANLSTSVSLEDVCSKSELLIEAVPEEMKLKLDLFATFGKLAKPDAILASNTSSLSIAEMGGVTSRAGHCIGLHFFNPVPKMKLIEIIRAPETADATVAACAEVGRRMGKEVVIVRESPGFITSRINATIGNEAFYMLQEGIASPEDIDKALKLGLNHPMGPFELVDLVGLDVRLRILEYLHKTLGEKYCPCPLLVQYVREGRLGRKSGRGVYDYAESGERKATSEPNPSAGIRDDDRR